MNRRGSTLGGNGVANREAWARWVFPALLLSLMVHGAFWLWSQRLSVHPLSEPVNEKPPTRTFKLERADVDARLMAPAPDEAPKARSKPVTIPLPEEKISIEKNPGVVGGIQSPPKLDQAILAEKPGTIAPLPKSSTQPVADLPPVKDAATEEILREMPLISNSPASPPPVGPASIVAPSQSGFAGQGKGFSDLDKLLAQTGPLTPDTAPILMPGDVLFDYDAHALQSGAVSSLEKLGTLLKRNPNSRFVIEGHTDSYGRDDYNLRLSQLRAESVKNWLVSNMGIPAESVETLGLGKTRLIAPASASIPEQQINRRVEIVIRPPSP